MKPERWFRSRIILTTVAGAAFVPQLGAKDAEIRMAIQGTNAFMQIRGPRANATLDHVAFGAQQEDIPFGRSGSDPDVWKAMVPTPGAANR